MSDYRGQAERLREWGVLDIQNQPALTVGMLRSAGAAIERLADEVDRLNHENFWLSRNQKPQEEERMMEVPPLNKGDRAWGIGGKFGKRYVRSGIVSLIEIVDGEIVISVKGVCHGIYGKRVFSTRKDAEAAMMEERND